MIKGFIAIDNGKKECVVQYFNHQTMMRDPAYLKRLYDEFLIEADDFARNNLFCGTHIAYGICVCEDDSLHHVERASLALLYMDHHRLIDDFCNMYREKWSMFMRIAEKTSLKTLRKDIDTVHGVH